MLVVKLSTFNQYSQFKIKLPVLRSAVYCNDKPMITLIIASVPVLVLILNMCSQKWNNFAHFYLLGGYYVLKDKITSRRCRNLGKLSSHIIIFNILNTFKFIYVWKIAKFVTIITEKSILIKYWQNWGKILIVLLTYITILI